VRRMVLFPTLLPFLFLSLLASAQNRNSAPIPTASGQQWIVNVAKRVHGAIVTIETQSGLGTGFLVQKNGTIVTNYHVIKDAQQITVTLESGDIYKAAYLLRTDQEKDIAILRIEGADLPVISLGNSDAIEVGEEVMAIGTPEGLAQTVSNGIVSQVRQMQGYRMIQITAPISHGSSGGPLLNRAGQAIGITTLFLTEGQNLNFAVPINYVRGILDNLAFSPGQPERLISDRARVVNRPSLTITASSPTVTYGEAVPTIRPTYSEFVNGDSVAVVTTAPTCTTTYTMTSNAGSSPETTCSGGAAANYSLIYVPGKITVNKAPLTITASSHSVTADAAVPMITASYSGFVNGQSAAVLTPPPTCTIAYNSPLRGQTTTRCFGAAAANYSFLYIPGTITEFISGDKVTASPKPEPMASTPKLNPVPPTPPATIWFYRTKSATDSMLNPTIYSRAGTMKLGTPRDGALAKLEKGQFFALAVPAGTYYFSFTDKPKAGSEAWITVISGQHAFFKVRYTEIKPVFPYEAAKDFKNLKAIEPQNVRSSDVLIKAPN